MAKLMKPIKGEGVELVQLVGSRPTKRGGRQNVAQAVDLVCLEGQMVGQLGRHSDSVLLITAQCTEEERALLHKEVTKLRIAEGRWLPRQEGRCIVWTPTPEEMESALNPEKDQELLAQAMARYGGDEFEVSDSLKDIANETDAPAVEEEKAADKPKKKKADTANGVAPEGSTSPTL